MIEEDAHRGICVYEETIAHTKTRAMTPKQAIELIKDTCPVPKGDDSPHARAYDLAIRALEVCDELGLLKTIVVKVSLWHRCDRLHQRWLHFGRFVAVQQEIFPDGTYSAQVRLPHSTSLEWKQMPLFLLELAAAHKFIKASAPHWEGK